MTKKNITAIEKPKNQKKLNLENENLHVLISAPYAMPVVDAYKSRLNEKGIRVTVADVKERLSEEELLVYAGEIDGLICGDDRVTKKVLDQAPRLKVISKWGTGVDSIDKSEITKRGIKLFNTPNAFSEPLADTVLGYMLIFARKLVQMDGYMKKGKWEKIPSVALNEKTLGIVGVGDCGKAVARRAQAFGMDILGNDIVEISPEFLKTLGVKMVSLDRLLNESDFISLHTTLNPTSFHLINKMALNKMKSSAVLINTCRGPVVEEEALVWALDEKRIAGAALDVFEIEPLPEKSPLRKFENCYLAPHNANSSPKAWNHVHENTIKNLLTGLKKD